MNEILIDKYGELQILPINHESGNQIQFRLNVEDDNLTIKFNLTAWFGKTENNIDFTPLSADTNEIYDRFIFTMPSDYHLKFKDYKFIYYTISACKCNCNDKIAPEKFKAHLRGEYITKNIVFNK